MMHFSADDNAGCVGPCAEPAPRHRHLLHPGDGGVRPHQCRLLHHPQRPRGSRLRGRSRGEQLAAQQSPSDPDLLFTSLRDPDPLDSSGF
jgi:hypothetical protein